MRIGNDFTDAGSWFVHMSTIQNQWETQSDVKNDLAVNWGRGADKGSVKKNVFLDLGHVKKCGFLHGVQHVSNVTF